MKPGGHTEPPRNIVIANGVASHVGLEWWLCHCHSFSGAREGMVTGGSEAKKLNQYLTMREPPDGRRAQCEGDMEHHLSEGAIMIAFAIYLLDQGARTVEVHPDGEHLKRYDLKAALCAHGFQHARPNGSTPCGGAYTHGAQTVTIVPKPGLGNVVAHVGDRMMIAECKGGIVNTRHPGQLSRLRRGLCEAVGLLMTRIPGEKHVAVVPHTDTTLAMAQRMSARAQVAGIQITLVDGNGVVTFVGTPS